MDNKLLIVLLADTNGHENMARALHALTYALQADAAGSEVELIFDGGGVEWAQRFPQDENFSDLYEKARDKEIIKGVCSFCSGAFDVDEDLKENEIDFLDEDNGHPNVGARIADGWQIVTI